MKNGNLGYCIKTGLIGLYKHKAYTIASIVTISACIFLFGAFFSVGANVKKAGQKAEDSVGISVFFEEKTDVSRIMGIRDEISVLEGAAGVSYVSADEAWEKYRNDVLGAEIAETFGNDNPLKDSASLVVYMNEGADAKKLTERIDMIREVRKVRYSEEFAADIAGLRTFVNTVMLALLLSLAAVAVFLVVSTISAGVNSRRDEISIMALIGASDNIIELPFVVEGFCIGFLGTVIPTAVTIPAYAAAERALVKEFGDVLGSFSFVSQTEIVTGFIPIAVVFGLGIGLITGWFAAKRKVRKIESDLF